MIGGSSDITTSPCEYDKLVSTTEVNLIIAVTVYVVFMSSIMQVNKDDMLKTSDSKRVSVLVRGLKVGEKDEIKPGLFKRDATVADEKGHMR